MRLWTFHPEYLDTRGLVAAWREGLLAQKALSGKTRGYARHPQLFRFKAQKRPLAAMAAYLHGILREAKKRGYAFNASKIKIRPAFRCKIRETRGQLDYEWRHFLKKIRMRDPRRFREYRGLAGPRPHPLFKIMSGKVALWERVK
jgi:hypothetical protein